MDFDRNLCFSQPEENTSCRNVHLIMSLKKGGNRERWSFILDSGMWVGGGNRFHQVFSRYFNFDKSRIFIMIFVY